ncbi:MAG: AAA family ATPase [Verrucomicrobia bacterium]|nr:AAA family ATPase [Verrucomicrobiota bacterium]
MHISKVTIENFRCFGEGDDRLELSLRPGLTALVGENDAGKTAVIDALRFALGTTDQDWFRLEDADFRPRAAAKQFKEIRIVCKFEGLSDEDKRAFIEYLSYEEIGGDHHQFLFVNWTAENTGETRKGRPYRRVEVHSGKNGDGPSIAPEAREFLRATYLRPLRDAEESLLAGRGSRLAQVLRQSNQIREGQDIWDDSKSLKDLDLSMRGIANLVNHLLEKHKGVEVARGEIDKNLSQLAILGDTLASTITVGGAKASPDAQLTELLEKLDLRLGGAGKLGLGSDNLLFMACELLLLAKESVGNRLLLIEEPEAHLHPQRQLRVMKYLQEQAEKEKESIQIIVTTHSPNLASAIKLNNLVMMHKGRAFSMAEQQTKLDSSDYRFLERFLDVTKANLFFARGVMIVEGDAENILLPTLAKLLGRDFTKHGVSIVNVGGVGLRRYAKIFQRKDEEKDRVLEIPVACVTDMDVMPDCAPVIIGKVEGGVDWPAPVARRWLAKKDFKNEEALAVHRIEKIAKAAGQRVQTFVSDEWTLEFDLALGPKNENGGFSAGLAKDVFVAASLADQDDAINANKKTVADVEQDAEKEFAALEAVVVGKDHCSKEEVLASHVYAKFVKRGVSKPIAAQYLASRLQVRKKDNVPLSLEDWHELLPKYLVRAIDCVTREFEAAPEGKPEPNE